MGLGLCVAMPAAASAEDACRELIEQSNAQFDAMRRHAAAFEDNLRTLNTALRDAERRNDEQTRHIERLEARLHALQGREPARQERLQRAFFTALGERLPRSTLYEVLPDRLIVASDPVFVFGKGRIGAEGEERLAPLAEVLRETAADLPAAVPWRLRIEGHSDRRPLRRNPHFDTNWELSAARAVSMLRFLTWHGLPEQRLSAVGMAATRVRDPGSDNGAHRRNRRVEIRLAYDVAAAAAPEPAAE